MTHVESTFSPPQRTPLYDYHLAAGGKMVAFAGWEMPVNYGSQIDEHHAVRQEAGVFDVSHMAVVDLHGSATADALRRLLANSIDKANTPGKALYTCMLTETGGIIDDLIVYHMDDDHYRLVVNAGNRLTDIDWLKANLPSSVTLSEQADLCLLAIQGPASAERLSAAIEKSKALLIPDIKRFSAVLVDDWFIARTGYTGEDGFEIALPPDAAIALWNRLLAVGVTPCGLGARDTLRLEAGLNLHGSDMSPAVTPLECGLDWTVGWQPEERAFIGRAVLESQRTTNTHRVQKGLVLEDRGVLRGQQRILQNDQDVGEVTSGTFSPTLQQSIGLARVDKALAGRCEVVIRNRKIPASVVTLPFVKSGVAAYQPIV